MLYNNHLTVYRQMSSNFLKIKFLQTIHLKIINVYEKDLELNNFLGLICH